jgi:hypothetical protein
MVDTPEPVLYLLLMTTTETVMTRTNRSNGTQFDTRALRRLIKAKGLDCKVGRVGTGKHWEMSLSGRHARLVADAIIAQHNWREAPMSGIGGMIDLRPPTFPA